MINDRLVWLLESQHLITDFQCGFRRGRSTLDHLIRLESFIRNAFIKKEHVVAVFFDLEKAYDTTWKYGIMKDLYNMGFRGRLPIFISNFLSNRHFRVRVNATLSDIHNQELGVPQGSILSVTLFSIKINSIVNVVRRDMPCSLYVDDFLICYRGRGMNTIERQLQLCLNRIHEWSVENGFKFSKTKTVCVHFCLLRTLHPDPVLTMDGDPIEVAKETKFLGLTFDNKLSFLPHIKALKCRCVKALDAMKVLASTEWGADSTVLLRLYRALVRSKLDYGSIVYGSARKSYIKQLDTVHHQGLRLALGAFRTSPVESLYVAGREPSLYNRRIKLALQYTVKLRTNPRNPAYDCVFRLENRRLYEACPSYIRPFGYRTEQHLEGLGVNVDQVTQTHHSDIPPWQLKKPSVIFQLATLRKSETPPLKYQQQFLNIRASFSSHRAFYTDGSKDKDKVSAAAVFRNHTYTKRLQGECSIFTAEARALLLALESIELSNKKRFLVCSDSLSCLQALSNLKTDHPILIKILSKLNSLSNRHFDIHFCWVPGHVGLRGNELADRAAKLALRNEVEPCAIPHTDLRPSIHTHIKAIWQQDWDAEQRNKLHSITPTVDGFKHPFFKKRRDDIVFNRCRIGHSRLTHVYRFTREPCPKCIPCQCPFTLKHVLLDCTDFVQVRRRFYQVTTLQDLFNTVEPEVILKFLKAAGLYMLL